MKVRFFNFRLNDVIEKEIIAEGLLYFYCVENAIMIAIPKDEVVSTITENNEKVPSMIEYLKLNGENIRDVDFSLCGSLLEN